jgi:hypothetical protein
VNAPRIIEVDRQTAEDPQRTAALAEFFLGDRMTAADAHEWAQSVMLVFPELEVDDEPILTNPVVRQFIARLYRIVPFFLFFVEQLEGSGMLAFLCAHARDDQIVIDERQNFRVDTDAALDKVIVDRLADAATYAFRVGYPWDRIISGTRASDEHREAAREIVRTRIS